MEPATKSQWPSRSAEKESGTGNISSISASIPSSSKNPKYTAAMAGKYELETKSGKATL